VTELVKLRFEDMNPLARTMLVKTAKQKADITDEQHMPDGVLWTVEDWSGHTCRFTGYLFEGGKPGTHLTTRAASMIYYKHAEAAGLDIASRRADQKGRGIHSTRHHYTTRLLVKGKPLQASIVLRHRNSESLSQYCASQDERRFVQLAGVIHGS
jgi:integrase